MHQAWMWHATAGDLMHNRTRSTLKIGESEEGATLSITIHPNGHMFFNKKGARVGPSVAPVAILPKGRYVLCCQPYMGGAARIL